MESHYLHLAQQALMLTVVLSAPPVLAAMVVGLALALVQALTQIQEQTLQTAAKIVLVFGTLYVFGYWMAGEMVSFASLIFRNFAGWVGLVAGAVGLAGGIPS